MTEHTTKTPADSKKTNPFVWVGSLAAVVAVLAALTLTTITGNGTATPAAAFEPETTTTEAPATQPEPMVAPAAPFAPVWEGPDEAPDLDALNDLDLPELPQDDEAEEPAPEPEPLPEPDPAILVVAASIDLDNNDTGVLTIGNDGDLPLDILDISSDFGGFSVNGPGNLVEGGTSMDFGVSVDDGVFPFGEYTVYVDVSTSAGEAVVELHGHKELLVQLIDYDVVIATPALFVAHGNPWATFQIINNEDFDVTLWVDEDHARLNSPNYITLNPGMNELILPIAPWAVDPFHVMQMQVDFSWIVGEQTVTITKMGM